MSDCHFTRRSNQQRTSTTCLNELFATDVAKERWLVVVPHDDDAVLGCGLWMMAAIEAGADVRLLAVTDGRLGYCTLEQQADIVNIRARELVASCELLGMDASKITCLGYPDGGLFTRQGRRPADAHEQDPVIEGYTGMTNCLTWHLRQFAPQRVIVPAPSDLHPDHQIVHNELAICLFHASGDIWPELGRPIAVPQLYEMAIYCDFHQPPNLRLQTTDLLLQRKLEAVAAFRSQLQIEQLVRKVEQAGPVEYLHEVDFRFYEPARYAALFE